jgi:phytoene synthase
MAPSLQPSDIEYCRKIHQHYGPNYYLATRLMPPAIRDAIHVVYAWVRIPDEIVDNPESVEPTAVSAKLAEWITRWQQSFESNSSTDPVFRAATITFKEFNITWDEQQAFFESMQQDLSPRTYQTYQELEQYMYGSAGIPGIMFAKITNTPPSSLPAAITNGYAMQLTNFLRDIGEDWKDRQRIYMPTDELSSFRLTSQDIHDANWQSDAWKSFMQFQIDRARKWYTEAWPAMKDIPNWRSRWAARTATLIYRDILTSIEQNHYDVFSHRAAVSKARKLHLAFKCLISPPRELS